jgi:ATP-binding protein involved in chromosome partitioning
MGDTPLPTPQAMPGIRQVIAVGAGKGGVGKSTVTLLAAVGLHRRGFRTAILDGDAYGPSMPILTGTEDAQPRIDDNGSLTAPEVDGVKVVSLGHLMARDQAVIWRGPMAQKYVKEMLDRTNWGELDYLFVDLPPGTGDIPLTLAQSVPLTGAVIVCTPQDVALADAIRALRMYQRLGVEPLGILENMSYFLCPKCGHREEIFSHGGARDAAAELNVPYLGSIPLNLKIRRHGDEGRPGAYFVDNDPNVIAALDDFISRLHAELERREQGPAPLPSVKIEG